MAIKFPTSSSEFLEQGVKFRTELRKLKQHASVPDYGWSPYETIAQLEIIARLIAPVYGWVGVRCRGGL